MYLGTLLGAGLGAAGGFLLGGPVGAAAGAAFGGSLGGGVDASNAQIATNDQNVALAQQQMAFQDHESSTAYQRATKDMEAAGLNPMLAYSQGGASTPSGALPVVQNPVPVGVSTAVQGMNAAMQFAQLKNINAQTAKTVSETMPNLALADNLQADTDAKLSASQASSAASHVSQAQVPNVQAQTALTNANIDLVNAQASGASVDADTKKQVFDAMKSGGGFTADVESRKAAAQAAMLALPEAKASASFYSGLGVTSPYVEMFKQIMSMRK